MRIFFRDPVLSPIRCFLQLFQKSIFSIRRQDIYYGSVRAALEELLRSQHMQGKSILVPSYICDVVVESIRRTGADVVYYDRDGNFNVDFAKIEKVCHNNTVAFLWVNYFGCYPLTQQCKAFCKKRNLMLINDNAHTLPLPGEIHGDYELYSLRKILPVSNGGLLQDFSDQKGQFKFKKNFVTHRLILFDFYFVLRSFVREILSFFGGALFCRIFFKYYQHKQIVHEEIKSSLLLAESDRRISPLSWLLWSRTQIASLAIQRKNNYCLLMSLLNDVAHTGCLRIAQKNIPEHCCPLAFPLYVAENVETMMNTLFLNGYVVYLWPTLPADVFRKACIGMETFAGKIILLPIHQDLARKNIEHLAHIVKERLLHATSA